MSFRRSTWACSIIALMFIFLFFAQLKSNLAAAQSVEPLLLDDISIVVQGSNDMVPGNESNNDFYTLKILSYELPYEMARVHTRAPQSAHDFNVWGSAGVLNSSSYGFETSGVNAGDFFVDVPGTHPRTAVITDSTGDATSFTLPGSEFSNTTYTDNALRLVSGFDSGEYVSTEIVVKDAHLITSATLVFSGNSSSNITSYLSNDGGTSWTVCQNNSGVDFASSGTTLRARFNFEGNASAGFAPTISSFTLNATYVLNTTVFTVHISYVWTVKFIDGKASLDVSESAGFAIAGSYVLMLYLVPGYEITSSGLGLTFDESGTMGTYPDKNLYYNMSTSSQLQSPTIVLHAPQQGGEWLYYVGALAIVLAFGLAFVYSRKSKSRKTARRFSRTDTSDLRPVVPIKEATLGDEEARRKVLVARKKEMSAEIDATRAKLASGAMTKKDARSRLASLKKEFKGVRNELNRISRKEVSSSEPTNESAQEPLASYESHLAALARIDEDFEKGRLSEVTYKNLRKEFVSKAAKSRPTEGFQVPVQQSEKDMLMEAIAVLDDERERGEIDEKLYVELSSSYRKQLVDLMKKSEDKLK